MLAEAFVSAGCYYYDNEEIFPPVVPLPYDIVIRRSLPHRGYWPMLNMMVRSLTDDGYHVFVIGIVRTSRYAILSLLRRDPSRMYDKLVSDYKTALWWLSRSPLFTLVTYEAFVGSPSVRKSLFFACGLPEPLMKFYDGNAKYYGQ